MTTNRNPSSKKYAVESSTAYFFILGKVSLRHRAIEERDNLGARAVGVRGERGRARAVGHIVLDRPVDGGGIVGARGDVGEAARAGRSRAGVRSPLEGDGLCARDGSIR